MKIVSLYLYLISERQPLVMSHHSLHPMVDPRFGTELTYLALARYHLVAHPNNPTRLGSIFSLVQDLEKVVSHPLIISLFFDNDAYGVVNFINNIIVPYNNASNKNFANDKPLSIKMKI